MNRRDADSSIDHHTAATVELECGSDEERRWRGEWLSRLMFGWMIGQRDPGSYQEWLTANGARLV